MAKQRRGGKVVYVRKDGTWKGMNNDTTKQVQPAQSISSDFNNFMGMTDDDKADTITKLTQQGVPSHLTDNSFQRFIYNMGWNDKPQVVDDATFNKTSGNTIYRTVNSVYDKQNDISYTAPQIAKQLQSGSITRVSSGNKAVYDSGLYFATTTHASSGYGGTHGDVNKTCQISAKLNQNAKVISYRSAVNGVNNEISSGSKLGKALRTCSRDSRASIYAVCKGYNVIDAGNGYLNVLNRQAMTIAKNVKPI